MKKIIFTEQKRDRLIIGLTELVNDNPVNSLGYTQTDLSSITKFLNDLFSSKQQNQIHSILSKTSPQDNFAKRLEVEVNKYYFEYIFDNEIKFQSKPILSYYFDKYLLNRKTFSDSSNYRNNFIKKYKKTVSKLIDKIRSKRWEFKNSTKVNFLIEYLQKKHNYSDKKSKSF